MQRSPWSLSFGVENSASYLWWTNFLWERQIRFVIFQKLFDLFWKWFLLLKGTLLWWKKLGKRLITEARRKKLLFWKRNTTDCTCIIWDRVSWWKQLCPVNYLIFLRIRSFCSGCQRTANMLERPMKRDKVKNKRTCAAQILLFLFEVCFLEEGRAYTRNAAAAFIDRVCFYYNPFRNFFVTGL